MASYNLHDIARSISEVVDASREVVLQKENFRKYSAFLKRISLTFHELIKLQPESSETSNKAVEDLKAEIKAAKKLTSNCSKGNKIYLLLSCRRIVEDLESSTKNIRGSMIDLLGSLDIASETNDLLMNLCKDMADCQYQTCAQEEEILQIIEAGIEERSIDQSYASNLLIFISKYVGISNEQSMMKAEFESFKNETQNIESRTEALRMEQIVLLLSNADIITSSKEKEMKYLIKRDSLGRQLLEPLQSFYCPITQDVMVDPVQTSSGQTFERAAIEKWLADGNNLCPLTKTPLNTSSLRPNRTLRQSMEEWRNRNTMISIASMKTEIQSHDDQEVLCALQKLHDLCKNSELHREWIVIEDYIPIFIDLLSAKNSEKRIHSLSILYYLAKDGEDNKVKIAELNESITCIVRLLARKVEESVLALQLLRELSKSIHLGNHIGNVQGCVLLLVTLASSDDARASEYAHDVLDNLSFLDQNVIQMAKAQFFKPLLQRLSEGPVSMKMAMAATLADLELTDHNKLCLSSDGANKPLLEMLSYGVVEVKAAAVKALQNLSGVPQNGLELIRHGAKDPLFELIFSHNLSIPKLREQVAKTIMHLAMSTTSPEAYREQIFLMVTEEDVFKLFSLISYSGPDLQVTLLLTFHALCKSPSGVDIRNWLRQMSAVKVLIQLCEVEELSVRVNAVKLFYYLIEDGEHESFIEHVNKKCINTLVQIIRTSNDEGEMAAAMAIIAHLPHNIEMSQNLLESGTLEVIYDSLTFRNSHAPHEKEIVKYAAAALCRFTDPSNIEWQNRVAEVDMIPVLVKLLCSASSSTKRYISISLKQMSESSSKLSLPVKRSNLLSLACCLGISPSENTCPVHLGMCTVKSSFCLLQADAVSPLVVALGEAEAEAETCEAIMDAILTLIEGTQLQNGCKVLEEANAVAAIKKMLNSHSTEVQEKALRALHRIFRFVEYKNKYGKSVQMVLVDITQRGSSRTKPLAAKILAQLNVLNQQSTFFDGNS
ncbi:U-box domain-containing protein 43-like [Andrographis paniculata]|uniref:U-box domain-containing protein 43-like n=1 Tax=Andrographis paniculata TaxID=175694 RepID=UPI0021E6EAD1|nr:U-box domain-containing protein 43-like [Andrographis paniculata]